MPFRILNDGQKFGRWDWINYQYTTPKADSRKESQKVIPESIVPKGKMRQSARAQFINPLVRENFEDTESRCESLTLIRPKEISFSWEQKTDKDLLNETRKHEELANQLSFFDKSARPLQPCPFQFSVKWLDNNQQSHRHICDDWETSTAFFRRRAVDGEEQALSSLKNTYEEEYMKRGLCLAFSTHSRRNSQWLLVGIIRLDDSPQTDLFL